MISFKYKITFQDLQRYEIHRESKKGDTILLSISSLNIDWFS